MERDSAAVRKGKRERDSAAVRAVEAKSLFGVSGTNGLCIHLIVRESLILKKMKASVGALTFSN